MPPPPEPRTDDCRRVRGITCATHGGLYPSLAHRCNAWVDRAEAADAPLREALDKLQTNLIRAFPVNGSYNRTAIWQAIQRVCGAALTATPALSERSDPAPLDREALADALYGMHFALASGQTITREAIDALATEYVRQVRLTARAAAADHEGFSPTPPGNIHWKRTPLARIAATAPTCGHDSIAADCPICAVYAREAATEAKADSSATEGG